MNIKIIRISTILLIIFLFTPITDYALSVVVIDQDNDGIPDMVETKLGLDRDNPDDALYDMDDDGFANVFEYNQGRNINNARSHPPLYMRLHLREFRETLLPCKLMLVNTNGDKKDPADWTIKIDVRMERGRYRYRYKHLDSTMFLDKTRYTITKIDAHHVDKRQGGSLVKIDKSKVYLKSKDGKYTITMQVGKPVYSPRPKAVIEDLGSGRMYHVGAGDTISMYMRTKVAISKKTGRKLKRKITKYKVFKVDRQKKQLIIEDRRRKKYVLTARAFMPRLIKVVIKQKLTKPVVIKPTVIQTAELKPIRLGQTKRQDNISETLKDMLYVDMYARNYRTQHPLICIEGGDYPRGSEMIFIKQSNPKEWVHAVFPKRTVAPKNRKKKVVLHGYYQYVQNMDIYRKRGFYDYKYFVVSSWEYQQ